MYFGICNKTMASLYLRMIPKPKYTFFLDVKPETAQNRKKEHSLQELTRYRQYYLFVAQTLKAPVISTDTPIEESLNKILSYVAP